MVEIKNNRVIYENGRDIPFNLNVVELRDCGTCKHFNQSFIIVERFCNECEDFNLWEPK